MKRILQAPFMALLATVSVAGGALAQEIDDVTVQASRVERSQVGYSSSGLPILALSVTHAVAYSDLDLTTTAGMAELQDRIHEAARHGCREIDMTYRLAQPSDWLCARLAARETLARIRELVAAN